MRVIFLLLCAIFATASARCDEFVPVEMVQRNWTTRDGLPQDRARRLLLARDGFLWIGTEGGLTRFDGVDFKTFGLQDGLGGTAILSLMEAHDGSLWISTLGGGVSVLRNGKIEKTYTTAQGLPSAFVAALGEDSDGRIWAGTRAGIAYLEKGRFEMQPNGNMHQVAVFYRDRLGVLWAAPIESALWMRKSGQWMDLGEGVPKDVTAFCEDADGRLWVADSTRHLWCKDAEMWKSFPLPDRFQGPIDALACSPDGTIWASFYHEGICGFRNGKFVIPMVGNEEFGKSTEALCVTQNGLLLVGSPGDGFYSLAPARVTVATMAGRSINGANTIGGIAEIGDGGFLVGTQGHGFYRWGSLGLVPIEPEPDFAPNLVVNAMCRTADGSVWAGTGKGLFQFRAGRRVPWSDSDASFGDVWELCDDRGGGLWAGLETGILIHLVKGIQTSVAYGSSAIPIKGLAQDADGTLWVGTRGNGLYRGDGDKWRRYGHDDGLMSDVIRVVHIGADRAVWVGTSGAGLAVLRGNRFISMTTCNGLPDDTVSQIATDEEGRLWVGTNRGLAVFSKEDVAKVESGQAEKFHPVIIDRFDGLLSEEFTIVPPVRTSSGRMAFGTMRGFALLSPGDFRPDERSAPVAIEGVFANGAEVHPAGETLVLRPGTERLELRFSGLNLVAPERLQFRTRLVNLEKGWGEPTRQRSVEYRNLPPGKYRFEVSSTTGNGKWSRQPAILGIELEPHVWETAWFRAVAAAAVLLAIAYAARQRERRRVQRKIEALERRQVVDAERARIARDLHDDIGASLTQVALLSELLNHNLPTRPERAGQQAHEIFATARSITRTLDEIVWAVDPEHDTLERFALFLGTFVQNYAHTANMRARLEMPLLLPEVPLPSTTRHHLYLACKELLHNIVKHAGATEIRASLEVDACTLKLTINDNGRGFEPAGLVALPGDNGLQNIRHRIASLGGRCTCSSVPGSGTSVELLVPLVQ